MRSFLIFLLGLALFTVALFILSPVSIFSINASVFMWIGKQSVVVLRVIGWACGVIGTLIMMSQV